MQFRFENRPRIIFKTTHNGRVNLHTTIVATRREQHLHVGKFGYTFLTLGVASHNCTEIGDRFDACRPARRSESQNFLDCIISKFSALGEIAAFIKTALAEQKANAFRSKLVELVDGTQYIEALGGIALTFKTDSIQHTVKNLAVIDADRIIATTDA